MYVHYTYIHKRGEVCRSEMGIFHEMSAQQRPLFGHVIIPETVRRRYARALVFRLVFTFDNPSSN